MRAYSWELHETQNYDYFVSQETEEIIVIGEYFEELGENAFMFSDNNFYDDNYYYIALLDDDTKLYMIFKDL